VTFGLSTFNYCYCLSVVTQFVLSHFPHLRCISSPLLQSRRDSTRILPLRHTPRNVGHSSLSYFHIRSSPLVAPFVCDTPFFLLCFSKSDLCCDPCSRDIPTPLSLRHTNTTTSPCHLLVPYMHIDKSFGICVIRDRYKLILNHHSNQSRSSCSAHQTGKKAPFYI
jgi:hypothetical protein